MTEELTEIAARLAVIAENVESESTRSSVQAARSEVLVALAELAEG